MSESAAVPFAAVKRAPHVGDGLGAAFDCLAHAHRHALPEPLWRALVLVPPPADPEEALWRDVIGRACLDAIAHVSPVSGKNAVALAARFVAEAREFFAAERDRWRSQVFEMAGLDETLILALVRAAVRLLERDQGVVAVPPERAPPRRVADMPGANFEIVRGPRRPFQVETVKRRVSVRDREAARVIFSYLNRSNAHAAGP